jgi:crossover junction endodeoxyribonuclease RusA
MGTAHQKVCGSVTTKQQMTFAVRGNPRPKGRPRFTKYGHAYTPKDTKGYEKVVRVAAMAALTKWRDENQGLHWNAAGPFALQVHLFFDDKRKRDLDNCLKSISDALNKLLYDDDHQIDHISAERYFDAHSPRAVVTVTRLRARHVD